MTCVQRSVLLPNPGRCLAAVVPRNCVWGPSRQRAGGQLVGRPRSPVEAAVFSPRAGPPPAALFCGRALRWRASREAATDAGEGSRLLPRSPGAWGQVFWARGRSAVTGLTWGPPGAGESPWSVTDGRPAGVSHTHARGWGGSGSTVPAQVPVPDIEEACRTEEGWAPWRCPPRGSTTLPLLLRHGAPSGVKRGGQTDCSGPAGHLARLVPQRPPGRDGHSWVRGGSCDAWEGPLPGARATPHGQ